MRTQDVVSGERMAPPIDQASVYPLSDDDDAGLPSHLFLKHLRAHSPGLRAYATMLLGSVGEADDLVQETLLRAWRYRGSFRADTSAKAWLFRILRNEFLTWVSRPRHTEDVGGRLAARLSAPATQETSVRCSDTLRALQKLTPRSREVLALMAAGTSYEDAAMICHCSVGTVKSRINRARETLLRLVDGDDE
jgi:RNA polymerase sigma-70 factor (ECF subfamily)